MSFWQDRNVFITGATGLLGSWMVEELVSQGANITCLIRDWIPDSKLVASGLSEQTNLVYGELQNYDLMVRVLNEYEINTVFHFGAQTIGGTSSRSALSTFESNIKGTWTLLEACRENRRLIERIVVASSEKAYGSHNNLPYTEDMALQGRFPHDVSKSCSDLIAQSYFHTYRLPLAITRSVNLFGGGDLNFNRLIPGTIRSALRNESPIIRSNWRLVRDYFFVLNAVDGYIQLAEKMPDDALNGEALNFGYGEPLSVIELVDEILDIMGKSHLRPVILNEESNEITDQYLDCSKAQRLLNWRPMYKRREGLRQTISWYEEYLESKTDNTIASAMEFVA